MTSRFHTLRALGMFLALFLVAPNLRAQEPPPVVHAVLFYSPTCPHCRDVINNFLIPLQNEYGNKLVILGFDSTQQWANDLFWAALRHYEVPEEKWAVPFMIVDDHVMVGADEIPNQLPAILDQGLENGGIDLPDLPELLTFLDEQGMLDHRYPDRRIALQGPQEEEEAGPPTSDSVSDASTEGMEPDAEGNAGGEAVSPGEASATGAETAGSGVDVPSTDAARDGVLPDSGEASVREGASSSDTAENALTTPAGAATNTPSGGNSSGGEKAAAVSGSPQPSGSLELSDAAHAMDSMTMGDRFKQDLMGNSVAVLVLLGMLLSVLLRGFPPRVKGSPWPKWSIPVLGILGMGVAAYLSYIEVTQVQAVCGPVGDCNTVNQSSYATLFGVLPVGILGLLGYAGILSLWAADGLGSEGVKAAARIGLWGGALFGTLFSIYLTFLEPFVIGATCAWCLSSAVIMTLILWTASPLAAQVWPRSAE